MNKGEILKMEAGEKLDELVVGKVMGYEKPNFFPPNALELHLAGDAFHIPGWTCVCIYDEGDVPKWVPDLYSTDISAAWQVVDKMFGLGYAMSLLHLSSEFHPEYWYCDFRSKDSNEPPGYEWIDHQQAAPEAICKAALLAKVN